MIGGRCKRSNVFSLAVLMVERLTLHMVRRIRDFDSDMCPMSFIIFS